MIASVWARQTVVSLSADVGPSVIEGGGIGNAQNSRNFVDRVDATVSGGIVRAGPLEDGIATYRSGDYATALRILPSLAEQGNAAAQFNLGSMYAHGQGVTLDYREAVKWYRQGAEQGNATAQVFLGLMYGQGQGVVQEYLRAHMWLNLAASKLSGNEGQGATEGRKMIAKHMTTE